MAIGNILQMSENLQQPQVRGLTSTAFSTFFRPLSVIGGVTCTEIGIGVPERHIRNPWALNANLALSENRNSMEFRKNYYFKGKWSSSGLKKLNKWPVYRFPRTIDQEIGGWNIIFNLSELDSNLCLWGFLKRVHLKSIAFTIWNDQFRMMLGIPHFWKPKEVVRKN